MLLPSVGLMNGTPHGLLKMTDSLGVRRSMQRWMCGVTRMERIRNTRIRGTVKVTEIATKVQERKTSMV